MNTQMLPLFEHVEQAPPTPAEVPNQKIADPHHVHGWRQHLPAIHASWYNPEHLYLRITTDITQVEIPMSITQAKQLVKAWRKPAGHYEPPWWPEETIYIAAKSEFAPEPYIKVSPRAHRGVEGANMTFFLVGDRAEAAVVALEEALAVPRVERVSAHERRLYDGDGDFDENGDLIEPEGVGEPCGLF